MKKTWKKLLAAGCAAAMLMTMPGMYVLADEMREELIVTEAEVPEETINVDNSQGEDAGGVIEEANISPNETEIIVGEGPIQVGDGVTATFNQDTGAVELTSQDGVLWPDWVRKLGVSKGKIKSIKVISGIVYLPSDSSGYDDKMFSSLSGLTELNLSGFNASNVTDMGRIFYNCRSLLNLNLSGFDTSSVTSISVNN